MSKVKNQAEQDQEIETLVKPPQFYVVKLLNDHFTTMEFVIHVLKKFFHHDEESAYKIMLQVHQDGSGVCGVYSFDIAQTKANQVIQEARQNKFPLQCVVEPQEGEND